MRLAISALFCFACLGLAAPAFAQPECVNVGVACTLNDLGNDEYEYVFTLVNNSAYSVAVFFWVLESGNVPQQWQTIAFDVPAGWTGAHPGTQLHFKNSNNGDGNPTRSHSPSSLQCGNGSLEFRWTFRNEGGPVPACDFDSFDYLLHLQAVNEATCANVGDSFTCPGVVPAEPTTWGLIKTRYDF